MIDRVALIASRARARSRVRYRKPISRTDDQRAAAASEAQRAHDARKCNRCRGPNDRWPKWLGSCCVRIVAEERRRARGAVKSPKLCGVCHEPGHNRRTCTEEQEDVAA